MHQAVSQSIRNQGDDYIPKLFIYAQLVMGVSKNEAQYATAGTGKKFWGIWKEEIEPQNTQIDTENNKPRNTQNTRNETLEEAVNRPLKDEEKETLFSGEFAVARGFFDRLEDEGERLVAEQDRALFALCRPERKMNAIPHSIDYGSRPIRFGVVYAKRKTLQIEVYPDGKILVKAPIGTRTEEIEKRVLRRSRWVGKQLDYFQQFEPRTPPRRYIGGETHLYLGRQYRLKIIKANDCSVKLVRGDFLVSIKGKVTSQAVKSLLDEWYAAKAAIHFQESFKRCWPRFKKMGMAQRGFDPRTQGMHRLCHHP